MIKVLSYTKHEKKNPTFSNKTKMNFKILILILKMVNISNYFQHYKPQIRNKHIKTLKRLKIR